RSPSYIETISKRGYRLIAAVRPIDGREISAAADPALPLKSSLHPLRRYRAWAGAIAVMLALVATGVYLFHTAAVPDLSRSIEAEDTRPTSWITVTVVPFESLGTDDEQAYLARGISDDLMTDLSRLSGLRLIRQSTAASANPAA